VRGRKALQFFIVGEECYNSSLWEEASARMLHLTLAPEQNERVLDLIRVSMQRGEGGGRGVQDGTKMQWGKASST